VTITLNPANVTTGSGTSASFSADATGTPTPSVAWWYSIDGGTSYMLANVGTSTSFTLPSVTTADSGWRFEAVFTNSTGSATSTSALLTVNAVSVVSSYNWAGYVTTAGPYTHASGTFVVPTAQCTSATTYSSTWVGIDGYGSSTVEQDGFASMCSNGVASYNAWYEMYGDTSVQCNCYAEVPLGSAYPVVPGDVITASVDYANSNWTLALVDATRGWNFSIVIATYSPAPAQVSAEWILEQPSMCTTSTCTNSTLATLTPQGTTYFSNITASAGSTGGISNFPYAVVSMVGSAGTIASPGPLSSNGTAFDIP
jgi:hypothetical protein